MKKNIQFLVFICDVTSNDLNNVKAIQFSKLEIHSTIEGYWQGKAIINGYRTNYHFDKLLELIISWENGILDLRKQDNILYKEKEC